MVAVCISDFPWSARPGLLSPQQQITVEAAAMRALYYLVALLAPVVDLKWFEEGLWYVDFTVNLAVGKNRKFTMEVRPFLPSLVLRRALRRVAQRHLFL